MSTMQFWTLSIVCLAASQIIHGQERQQAVKTPRSVLSSQGIVVPKRSSFIYGLNEQFKPKQTSEDGKNVTSSSTQPSIVSDAQPSSTSYFSQRLPTFLLGSRGLQLKKQQQQQQLIEQQPLTSLQDKQALYMDRHQQELLAANPNLTIAIPGRINPQIRAPNQQKQTQSQILLSANQLASGALASTLLLPDFSGSQIQKSLIQSIPSGDPFKQQYQNTQATLANTSSGPGQTSQSASPKSQSQVDLQQHQHSQLYRGYSLFELDIKSESERRYMKDMYANLSALINEQASNSNTSPQVSPYVDVDFWSFGRANLNNDQIDVMVSPRSKPFLMAQLAKAKIRFRIKIDDIQARIDRDQANQVQANTQLNLNQNQDQDLGSSSSLPLMNPFSYSNTNSLNLANNKGKQQAESSLLGRQSNDIGGSGSTSGATSTNGSKLVNESAFFENYQRLHLINQYLEYIVQRDSDVAQVKVIGRSSQGRHLRVLKLGYERMDGDNWEAKMMSASRDETPLDVNNNIDATLGRAAAAAGSTMTQSQKQQHTQHINATHIMQNFFARQQSVEKLGSIWLDGGTHAREWISVSTVLYLAFRLSDNHNRCGKFFTSLRSMVGDYEQSVAAGAQQLHQQQNLHQRAANVAHSISQLEANLFTGLNELNAQLALGASHTVFSSSPLTGKQGAAAPSNSLRPRSEMEQMLELIAKNPQVVASEFGCDLEVDQLLRRYTFFIMPVLNPDGYEYSHTHNRLWRKTRSTSNHPIYRHFCLGADPNRNYDAHHGSTGSSSHPCSQTFAGATPFTEPETRHQSNFVYANRFGMKMYISFHSYSQMILLPLSHSKGLIPDLKDLESVGNAAAKAIEQTHGTQYRVGQSAAILYTAAGTASDWAYEKANVKYSYTIELRDTGSFGFLLPRQQIIPTGEETFNGLLAMISQMEKNDNLLTSKSTPLAGATSAIGGSNALVDYNRASQVDLDKLNSFANKRRAQLESIHSIGEQQNGLSINSSPVVNNGDELHQAQAHAVDVSASGNAHPTAGSSLLGVRDRRPSNQPSGDYPAAAAAGASAPPELDASRDQTGVIGNSDDPLSGNEVDGQEPGVVALSPMDPLGQPMNAPSEHHSSESDNHDHDGESGYAFENEGELMEPANNGRANEDYLNDISNGRAHVAEAKLTSRRLDSVRRIGQMARLGVNGRNTINSPQPVIRDSLSRAPSQQIMRRESSGNPLLLAAAGQQSSSSSRTNNNKKKNLKF